VANENSTAPSNNYVPLHLHSHFSLMDGVSTTEEYVSRAIDNGMRGIAITDHGTLSGHRAMYRAATSAGIKPVLGIEAYFTPDRKDRRDYDERTTPLDKVYNHLIILAKNNKGLANLNKMSEISWNDGFFKKPRIDFELLEKYGDGLIISSACMGGLINQAIEQDELAVAKGHLKWFGDRFGDDFYVEVMPHNPAYINQTLIELADHGGHKIIVTPDCHHATVDQKIIQEVMLINNTHPKQVKDTTYAKAAKIDNLMDRLDYLYDKDRKLTFNKFDIHLLSADEMREAMENSGGFREDMFSNTEEILDKVEDYKMPRNLNLLPTEYQKPADELRRLAYEGLAERGFADNPEYVARLDEELSIIHDKGFEPYFLVVRNMLNWARKQGIMVGPGRGSAAGSLLSFCLYITDIDPIPHGLLFFRFIDPSRDDFPDIDSDIQDSRRDEVKAYLEAQYRHVASIATYQEFKDKGVVRDVARVFNVPLSDVNRALKSVDVWEAFAFSRSTAWFREKYPEVVTVAEQLRGRIRGTGIHAAGMVTAKSPISKVAPMETRVDPASKERIPVVAVDMEEAADIGLIKIDILGLKTLSVIDDTLKTIKERWGKTIDLHSIPMDDKKVYEMISAGHTKGIFQCEAAPYTNLILKMGIRNFDELVASNALVRPGAMNTIGKSYVARKHGKQDISYASPLMKAFTEETYGTILYQEQVMLACTELGGMTMEQANKVRKIIGKKKDAKEFDEFKELFIRNASGPLGGAAAEKMWHDFEAHAGYSFNKSHAVAYSTLSYWTAWLKHYYPLEFMFCVLKNEKQAKDRTPYLIEAKRMGIPLRLPHINESDLDFKIEGKAIRFGLTSIKFLSDKVGGRYIDNRPFHSYEQVKEFTLTKGNGVNTRALSALDAVGAVAFPDNPRDENRVRSNLYEYLELPEFATDIPSHIHAFMDNCDDFDEKGVFIFMGVVRDIKRGMGWARVEILDATGSVGVFDDPQTTIEKGKQYLFLVGSNRVVEAIPVDEIATSKSAFVRFLNYKQLPYSEGEYYVLAFKRRVTKAGANMATLIVSNSNRELRSVVVFSREFPDAYTHLDEGKAFSIDFGKTKDGDLTYKGVLTNA